MTIGGIGYGEESPCRRVPALKRGIPHFVTAFAFQAGRN